MDAAKKDPFAGWKWNPEAGWIIPHKKKGRKMKTIRIELKLSKEEWAAIRLKHSEAAFRHILLQACKAEVAVACYRKFASIALALKGQKKAARNKKDTFVDDMAIVAAQLLGRTK